MLSLVMCPQYWKHAYAQHSHRTGTGKKDESSPFRPGRDSSTNVITAVRSQQVPSLFEGYTHFRRTPALPASATRVFFFFFANPHDDHGVVVSAGSYNGATRTGVITVYDSLLRTTKRLPTSLPRGPCSHVCGSISQRGLGSSRVEG
jgi:hypothetical protein